MKDQDGDREAPDARHAAESEYVERMESLRKAIRNQREARGEVGLADPVATGFKLAFGAFLFSLLVTAVWAVFWRLLRD